MKYMFNKNQNKPEKQRRKHIPRSANYDLLSYFSDTILFEYNCESDILTFTPNIANRFHMEENQEVQLLNPQEQMNMIHPDDADLLRSLLREAEERAETAGGQIQSVNLRFVDKNGAYCWMLCQIQVLADEKGRTEKVVGKLSDIQEQRLKEQRLIEKASVDSLTGILNRKAVDCRITDRLTLTKKGISLYDRYR